MYTRVVGLFFAQEKVRYDNEIDLTRHGEIDWNREGRPRGQRDIVVNANGIRQTREEGACLRDHGISFDRVVPDPLCGAVESAEIVVSWVGYPKDDIVIESLLRKACGALSGKEKIIK